MKIGIDIGGSKIAAGVVSLQGKILGSATQKVPPTGNYRDIARICAACADIAAKDAGLTLTDATHVGVGVPGRAMGERIFFAPNIGLKDAPLGEEIAGITGIKASVANDSYCAAVGEALFGKLKGHKNAIFLTLGTGIGCGIIICGRLYSGALGGAGEVGHMTIVADGEQCACGKKGCFERYASALALSKRAALYALEMKTGPLYDMCGGDGSKVDGQMVVKAFFEGDEACKRAIDEFIHYLSIGVTNLVDLLQPNIIAIGGGISHDSGIFLSKVNEYVNLNSTYRGYNPTVIVPSDLGNEAGIIGAAMLDMADSLTTYGAG